VSVLVRLPRSDYRGDAFENVITSGFDLGMARAMAWLSQLAYEDDERKILSVGRDWGLEPIAIFKPLVKSVLPIARTRGLVMCGHGARFVTFCGTDPLVFADWITDLDFALNEQGVHRGFGSAHAAAWPTVSKALEDPQATPVLFGGHSLGGALAVLAAWAAGEELGLAPSATYTFGMPRVGAAQFARKFNQAQGRRTYRLVYGADIVPTVPPPGLAFRHIGRMLPCRRGEHFHPEQLSDDLNDAPAFCEEAAADLRLSFSENAELASDRAAGFSLVLPGPISDHLPRSYCGAFS